jgi:hypothetical protein
LDTILAQALDVQGATTDKQAKIQTAHANRDKTGKAICAAQGDAMGIDATSNTYTTPSSTRSSRSASCTSANITPSKNIQYTDDPGEETMRSELVQVACEQLF